MCCKLRFGTEVSMTNRLDQLLADVLTRLGIQQPNGQCTYMSTRLAEGWSVMLDTLAPLAFEYTQPCVASPNGMSILYKALRPM